MRLQATTYSRLHIVDEQLPNLVAVYADWVLGRGAFSKKRTDRLKKGIPRGLTGEELVDGGDFPTQRGVLRTRSDPDDDQWVVHWSHVDTRDDRMSWQNAVLIRQDGADVFVEHFVGRQTRRSLRSEAFPPATLRVLVKTYGEADRLLPLELVDARPIVLDVQTVAATVERLVLDAHRQAPVVVFAPLSGQELNADRLADCLVGMAAVVVLPDNATRNAWNQKLKRDGNPKLLIHPGAVRTYQPSALDDPYDHPMLSRASIAQMPPHARERRVGGLVVRGIARGPGLKFLSSAIQQIQLKQWRAATRVLLDRPASHIKEAAALQAQIAALRAQLTEAQEIQTFFDAEHGEAVERAEQLERAADRDRQALANAREKLSTAFRITRVASALDVAGKVFPNLIILQSARRASAKSPYRNHRQLFAILGILAEYGRAGRSFRLSEVLKLTFGPRKAKWKPKDSDETLATFGTERRFRTPSGELKQFSEHITCGGGARAERCLQIYFHALDSGDVEIGWCGRHLRTVGQDT